MMAIAISEIIVAFIRYPNTAQATEKATSAMIIKSI
jgi:hypothetical protein